MKIGIITRFGMPLKKDAFGYYYRLHYLVNELVNRGHQVIVLAHPKSKVQGQLIKANVKNMEWETQLITYANFLKKYGDKLDIINAQTDHMCCFLAPFVKIPIVHTIIYGGFWPQVEEILQVAKKQYFTTISQGNKKCYPFLNWQGVVHNGLEKSQFEYNNKPDDYLLFLGRVCHEKGVEEAIEAANLAGKKLIIAGQPSSETYFNSIIKPKINKNIKYFGIANFNQKIKLFKNAKAVLHPHLLPEGFGNTMIEAQACGTPVIAYPYGSSPEVIKDKKTGFIVKDIKGMVSAIKKIDKINRQDCRDFVEKNFSIKKMVDGYENIFKKIVANNKNVQK